jgi:hypothetical protein
MSTIANRAGITMKTTSTIRTTRPLVRAANLSLPPVIQVMIALFIYSTSTMLISQCSDSSSYFLFDNTGNLFGKRPEKSGLEVAGNMMGGGVNIMRRRLILNRVECGVDQLESRITNFRIAQFNCIVMENDL